VLIFLNNNYSYIWYDEGYTIALIRYSYIDIWQLTATDVHPPLYYYLLKAYVSITGFSLENVRFFSAIPILLTIIAGCTIVRKLWGDKTAIFFIIITLLTPATHYMASEIRMYSWCMFFVLMAFLYAYISYMKGTKSSFFLLALFSLMAAYTQYYGLMAAAVIYGIYFFLFLFNKRKEILPFIISALVFGIAYIPWLIHLITQLTEVSSNYWITSDSTAGMIEYFFPVATFKHAGISWLDKRSLEVMIPVVFFIFILISAIKTGKKKIYTEGIIAALAFLFPILFGLTYSYLVSPVFYPRYVCCSIGLYYLAFALFITSVDLSKVYNKTVIIIFFIVFTIMSITALRNKVVFDQGRTKEQNEIISYINEEKSSETAILYQEDISLPFPILFPDYGHITKTDNKSRPVEAAQYIISTSFDHIKIPTYTNIDPQYQYLYAINPSYTKKDSAELFQNFDIISHRNIRAIDIYKMKKKE
jgi:uncharacterized membrane protein